MLTDYKNTCSFIHAPIIETTVENAGEILLFLKISMMLQIGLAYAG